jgi:chromosome segregation and condensation protein ScpB
MTDEKDVQDLPVGPAGIPLVTPEQQAQPLSIQTLSAVHPEKAHNIKRGIDKLLREANRCERRGIKLLERGKSYVVQARQLQGELDKVHKAVAAQNAVIKSA